MARQPRKLMRQGVADLPTRAHVDAYTGPNGEVISDGDTLRLQDGATPGGIPLLSKKGGDPSNLRLPAVYAGGSPAFLRDLFAEFISGRKFGLTGAGTDQTANLNKALAEAEGAGKVLQLASGGYGVNPSSANACLTAKAPKIRGEQGVPVVIFPMDGATAAHSILRVESDAAFSQEFLEISGISILPGQMAFTGQRPAGTKYGGKALEFRKPTVANLAFLKLTRLYLGEGNDYSLWVENNDAVNPQGGFSNSLISECTLRDGFYGRGIGDSNKFHKVVFHNSSPLRNIIDMGVINAGGGPASCQVFDTCSIGGLGSVVLRSGRQYVFENLNGELGNSSGSTGGENGCLIDARGDLGEIVGLRFVGANQAAIFGDTTATKVIRLGRVRGAEIDCIEISSGKAGTECAVEISADATDTYIGGAVTSQDRAAFTTFIKDNGVGSRGVDRHITGLIAGATEASTLDTGFQPLSYRKSRTGRVAMAGAIIITNTDALQEGAVLFTLPARYRPTLTHYASVRVLKSGVSTMAACEVRPNGAFVLANDVAGNAYTGVSRVYLETVPPWLTPPL